ncbi:MAG: type II toxin-antitoxin system HicB family antitoxin [Bacteroidetes bacterium]|jgi:predicted HicB family RNase H-like nuclease|nr:type II toxin-antitoxin system HicB family antitoxin [Bacteroidota bacterium]MBT4398149.1 type II toxin-antitoxin system HicB family antitoxin [Bacteroidota bacterium]MBT7462644.1 type II toxin-antitoxin system HicB family antitoxin [Bacteroidota bacterium]
MKDLMKYKEYLASVHFSAEDEVFYGKIEGVEDLISFEGQDVQELKSSFHEAVDDYEELCSKTGKKKEKTYKGSFNIRVKPELHRLAARKSIELGISLNQLVEKAVKTFLSEEGQ